MNKVLSLAFSPCPNDTYIFHAMINNLVDTKGIGFKTHMADVEELNKGAEEEKYDICKLSYNAYCQLQDKYLMLRSGSALGFNNGPLLVKSEDNKKLSSNLPSNTLIAIPGEHTTAALLLKLAYPQLSNLKAMRFSNIEQAIIDKEVEAGVLIHEGRFTYKDMGLELIKDLGAHWQNTFSIPIPLGGIAIKRSLLKNPYINKLVLPKLDSSPTKDIDKNNIEYIINSILKSSIQYAMQNPKASENFIAENAQELSKDIQKKHIELFVNKYTLDIDEIGEKAINKLAYLSSL